MSYSAYPQFASSHGQQRPPKQTNNLWMAGVSIIVILIIVMTVTLLIVQRSQAKDTAGGDDGPSDDPTDDPTDDIETVELVEESCAAFDFTAFADFFGVERAEEQDLTSSFVSGDVTSVRCNYYSSDYDSATISITSDESEGAADWWQEEKGTWENSSGYEVTDADGIGDDAYFMTYGEEPVEQRSLLVISGKLQIEAGASVSTDTHSVDDADEMLTDMAEQSLALFADYA